MFDKLFTWLGFEACSLAGSVSEVLKSGPACVESQLWKVGVIFLGIMVMGLVVMVIGARRRARRRDFYRW